MQIVRAEAQFASVLTQITFAAKRHWGYPETWIELWKPSMTITPEYIDTHETWIAVMDTESAAYYSFNEIEGKRWLDNLWVLPKHMGQGLGRLLFEHALERCKGQDIHSLLIEADPNAQSFYEKMGARKVHEHHTEVDGAPRILPVMEINL
jgi:GNAT superfamily N-acetyltransferase